MLWRWLRAGAAVVILAALAWRLGTDAFVDGIRAVDLSTVLAALGIGAVTTVLSAVRWCLVCRALGLPLAFSVAVADYYRALLLNAVLPAGVLGDVHRAVSHGQETGESGRAARSVVLERTAGQLVLTVVGAFVLLAHGASGRLLPDVGVGLAVVGVLVSAVVVAVRRLPPWSRPRRTLAATGADVRRVLAGDVAPGVLALSVAVLAGHVALFLVAADAAGVTASAVELVPLLLVALCAMGLPINVGGFGPREAAAAWAFGLAGLGAAEGLTTAVVYGVLALLASAPGVVVLLSRLHGRTQPAQAG
ncbi:UPF0104 family protein [Allosaccharopolyspora coralli]|uniref:UPF0104 family protein n=1 Tax=Allosaccharopolyspora coralli TaxID=2665642 RepID=A0A5Q3Q2Z9_9PSEU|nr:lysylphosphatidylglycerol synthase transmembrane domain-containing protein [Allosaccharopolyspora coralli]QGK68961.1 UPF0104 family protein [Allosaccharopolyspora coralli]